MTIQQLRYFLALCEDLNYTHTAGRMYLSRQALRQSIAALEDELCGKLFVNNRNHLTLTEKGERFRAQAAPVVQQFDALCQQAYQDIQSAPLRLGISVALVPDYLPNLGEVLEAFRQQYPGIPLELASLSNDEVPVQLQRGALDAGLVMDPRRLCYRACTHRPFPAYRRRHGLPQQPFLGADAYYTGRAGRADPAGSRLCPGCPRTAVAGTAGEQCTPTVGAGRAILSGTLPHAGAELCISEPF